MTELMSAHPWLTAWLAGCIGFLFGCIWVGLFNHSTDLECRMARHTRVVDEHEDLIK